MDSSLLDGSFQELRKQEERSIKVFLTQGKKEEKKLDDKVIGALE